MAKLTSLEKAAFDAGRKAYHARQRARSCPHTDEPLRSLWVRGWVRAQANHLYGTDEEPPSDAQVKAMDRWRTAGRPSAH
ncbi:MAG: ribosome modulation factor [Marmoricola sp.]